MCIDFENVRNDHVSQLFAIPCGFERKLKNTQRARYLRIAENKITSTTNFVASNA